MIKKEIKPFSFIIVNKDRVTYLEPGIYVQNLDTTFINDQYPNNWQVNFGGQPRLVLDAEGDMRLTGRIHALGSVIWNQETQQLQFWDGDQWVPINNTI